MVLKGATGLLCQLLVSICLFWSFVVGQDVVSIGGFVTVSSSLGSSSSVDLSSVRINVLDPNGVKKSEGDCSPNGYYFVPVDPGTYSVQVKGQLGWLFKPSEAHITCDQQHCNNGNDVNFELTGVQISGHVKPGPSASSCKAQSATYNDIKVTVTPADSKSATDAVTAVVQDSSFTLGPLLPGSYVIAASHPEWQIQPAQITHTVGLDSTQVAMPFKVSGYRLSGSVTSRSGPVAGIQVTLLSTDLDSAGCSATHPPGSVSAADIETALSTTALCSAVTDSSGRYTFPGIPCGQYTLQAQHPDPSSTFDIQPASIAATVGHGDAVVAEQFVVMGFSVTGRVVDGAGVGISGVSILVGGEEQASTDLNGRYVMAGMSEGRLDLTASKTHCSFTSLKAVHITPAAQVLPDIEVLTVAVCGHLSSGDARFKVSNRRVSLASSGGAATAHAEQTSTDSHGNFCFKVPPGRYRVAPYVTADEKSKGLLFSPTHADFEVIGEPILHLSFSQAQLTISGTVVCSDGPCPGDVQLSLKDAAGKEVYAAKLDVVAIRDKQATGSTVGFRLPRISPGRYTLSARKDSWCWASENGVEVVLEATDVEAPPLKQSGYQLQITTSHATELQIFGPSLTTPLTVQAPEGKTSVCVPSIGEFAISANGCYLFGAEKVTVNISPSIPPEPLVLKAVQVQIAGQISVVEPHTGVKAEVIDQINESVSKVSTFPDQITIESSIMGSDAAVGAITEATSADLDGDSPSKVYSYRLAVDLGSTVVITPSVAEDCGLLFYPKSQVVKHHAGAKQCPPQAGGIEARPGLVVKGSTEPAVEGAVVKIFYKTPSAAAGHAAGDLAGQGATEPSGAFNIGPLYDDATYTIAISKSGHIFTTDTDAAIPSEGLTVEQSAVGQLTTLNLKSKQLAQVLVSVDLPVEAEPSAVFLSLSGSGGFKNNARLGADRALTFYDLQPGVYYLKPLLREHRFEPPVAEMELTDGQAAEVQLTAVRTAWGISGVVTSVGGSPLAGASVEACDGQGASAVALDSSVTDEAGHYRIGNLKPDRSYMMRVKLDGRVTSAHPAFVEVDLSRHDVSGIDFIAARTSSRSALSAAIKLPHHLRTAIKAELLPAAAGSASAAASVAAAATVAVDASGFFEMRGLKPGSYVVKLSCDAAAAGGLSCEPWSMPVQVPQKDIHLGVLPFHPGATPSGGSTVAAAAAHHNLSDEGLDIKMPIIVLLCLIAGGFTVFKPAIVDILQLKATTIPDNRIDRSDRVSNHSTQNATSLNGNGYGRATAGNAGLGGATSFRGANRAGTAAANGVPKVSGLESKQAEVEAAAAVELDSSDDDVPVVPRQRSGAGARSRAKRA